MLTMYARPATRVRTVVHSRSTTSPSRLVKRRRAVGHRRLASCGDVASSTVGRQLADLHPDQLGPVEADEPAGVLVHGDVVALLVPDEDGDPLEQVDRLSEQAPVEQIVRFRVHGEERTYTDGSSTTKRAPLGSQCS